MTTTRVAALAVALLATAAGGAHAGTKTVPPRRETRTASYVLPLYTANMAVLGTVDIGGAQFRSPTWAHYVSAVVTDDTGYTMAFQIETATDDRGAYCGRTRGWVPIWPSATTYVTVNQGPCPDGSIHGVGIKGTVTVIFSDTR